MVGISKLSYVFFFLSSRGRHTRYWREWSSDVCSSDLPSDERERRWRHETVPAASFGVVDLAAPAFPAPGTRTVVVEDLLNTEATKKLGQCQVGKQDEAPLSPLGGGRDTGHTLLRAVRPRAGSVLRLRP